MSQLTPPNLSIIGSHLFNRDDQVSGWSKLEFILLESKKRNKEDLNILLQEVKQVWLNGDYYKDGKFRNEFYGSIPSFLFQCKNIEQLCIVNNGITSIPKDITNLKNLQLLRLSYNSLESIPDFIGELTNLTLLYLTTTN